MARLRSASRTVSTDASISRGVSRRDFAKLSFWTGLGALFVAAGANAANMLYPRKLKRGAPSVVKVIAAEVPAPGDAPVRNTEGRFVLVNLKPGEGNLSSDSGDGNGGLLALREKCPHLGCTVPWLPDFEFGDGRRGWFRCPCHASTYTKAGVRVFGPASRSMDTLLVKVRASGSIHVDLREPRNGGPDNPLRAVRYERA